MTEFNPPPLPSSAEVRDLYLLSPRAPPWRVMGPLYLFFFDRIDSFGIAVATWQLSILKPLMVCSANSLYGL
jgi:hypothetical protein